VALSRGTATETHGARRSTVRAKAETMSAEPPPRSSERLHRRARERGADPRLYALVRAPLSVLLRLWFRVHISGASNIPARGAAIIAPNHKSFLDAFFIALATRRHVRFMAKSELIEGPLGWLFSRLGAFPVRRGESDAEAIETARAILAQGGLLVIFPEGTRVEDPDALGAPHHGAGRLAVSSGAPIVPAAIAGTQRLWFGPLPKPRRVRLAFMAPIEASRLADEPDAVAEIIDRQVWPSVREAYGRELARPGVILAGLTAVGLGAGLLARRRGIAPPRVLGVVEPGKVRRRRRRRRRARRMRRRVRRLRRGVRVGLALWRVSRQLRRR
jgi:1-acyl-sn-glycerol-3-phosphate acyltransferase